MILKKNIYSLSIFFCLLAIPFAYYSFLEIRLLPIFILLSFVCVAICGITFKLNASMLLYLAFACYCLIISIFSSTLNVFFALLIFYWLAYWPMHIKEEFIAALDVRKLIVTFVLLGFFSALGLFIQIIAYKFWGIEFGKMDFEGNREAFGFMWNDYSFLSLFFASLIPLVWYLHFSFLFRVFICLIFIAASVLTSARTGFMAFVLAIAVFFIIDVSASLLRGKLRKALLFFLLFIFLVFPIAIFWLITAFPRLASLSGSGRLEGYISAFQFLDGNLLFGSKFDTSAYVDGVDVIPHNMFIYMLSMGGLFFVLLFCFWGVVTARQILKLKIEKITLSLLVSLFGFQLIPSFFSAYYFAFFIAICFIFIKKNGMSKK